MEFSKSSSNGANKDSNKRGQNFKTHYTQRKISRRSISYELENLSELRFPTKDIFNTLRINDIWNDETSNLLSMLSEKSFEEIKKKWIKKSPYSNTW